MDASLKAACVGAVRLTGVTKAWGSVPAVDQLDLDVRPGEFLSILGPSGCGKTTTLRMIAGFEEPDVGEVFVSEEKITHLPPYKRDVNTVFQSYALFPHMDVASNVAYGLRQRRVRGGELRQRVADALDMVKMQEYADRKIAALSGGQQQRVALARAIVNRPSVLLLDEPLAALDRKLREEMQIELKLLQQDLGMTFVFVTHDQQEALSMSDRIAVMRNGKIEQLATPDEIYDEPVNEFVAGFIGSQNVFAGRVRAGVVEGAYGPLRVRAGSDVADGSAVAVVVRPEAVRLSVAEPNDADNRVRARLQSTAHLGDVLQSILTLDDGHEVVVRTPRRRDDRLKVGTHVWCAWSAADALVFESESDSRVGAARGRTHLQAKEPV